MSDRELTGMLTFIASVLGGIAFGFWQNSYAAGLFFFFLMVCIDGLLTNKK